jgi:hypothetical protein
MYDDAGLKVLKTSTINMISCNVVQFHRTLCVPPKRRRTSVELRGITTQKIVFFMYMYYDVARDYALIEVTFVLRYFQILLLTCRPHANTRIYHAALHT